MNFIPPPSPIAMLLVKEWPMLWTRPDWEGYVPGLRRDHQLRDTILCRKRRGNQKILL